MVERILELMKEKNFTPSQFADEIGVQRSAVSHLISGRNKPSLEFMMKVLSRFPEVKPEYLLYGRKDTAVSNSDEAVPVRDEPGSEGVRNNIPDMPESPEIKHDSRPHRQNKREPRPERRIEKIVVFFGDRTFREYEPE